MRLRFGMKDPPRQGTRDEGFGTRDLDLNLGLWIWDLGLGIGDNKQGTRYYVLGTLN